jgi:transketolase
MLSAAVETAQALAVEHDLHMKVINLPWLNRVDENWLAEETKDANLLICIDNHYSIGGQYDRINDALTKCKNTKLKIISIGLGEMPACGTNQEILSAHGYDVESLKKNVLSNFSSY